MGAIPRVFRLGFQVRRSWEEGLGFKVKSLVNLSGVWLGKRVSAGVSMGL